MPIARRLPPDLGIPTLPAVLRFEKSGERLTVRLPTRRVTWPVVALLDARLSAVESVLTTRRPHVILAPHLSVKAKELIERSGWGWVESSGNAHVSIDGVFVHIERPEQHVGRPGGFSVPPQGERVIRALLDAYPRTHRFAELVDLARLDKGYASRILRRLRDTGLVVLERDQPVHVTSPAELFELWQTLPPRTTESMWSVPDAAPGEIARRLQQAAGDGAVAFTGPFASSVLAPHLEPERVDCYVRDLRVAQRLAGRMGAETVRRGGNLLLLVHKDPGVVDVGTQSVRGLTIASTSQVYRDALRRGRGREREAATVLRRERLKW